MNIFSQENHLNDDNITYEHCHEAYLNYLQTRGVSPFFISGWDVSNRISTPDSLLHEIIPTIEENINQYYLIEDDIGKTEVVRYLSKFGLSIEMNQVLVANSATSLLCYAIFSVTSNSSSVLVLNPTYYSTYDSLSLIKRDYVTINMMLPEFSLDCDKIEATLMSSNINTIVLTDPIFGSGIRISEENLTHLISLANKYQCTLIVDMARYGLSWSEITEPLLGERLFTLQKADHYAVIYSPCKKIFANGVKTGVLISSNDVAETLALYSDSVLGAVSSAQIEFFKVLLSPASEKYIQRQMENNISQIKHHYDALKSITFNTELNIFQPQMGHYALASFPMHNKSHLAIFHELLDKAVTFTLPMSLYGLSDNTNYLFRINLLADIDELVQSLWRILSTLEHS